ncbi:helix-turn-helix transcriptional regulator [Streptomyces clavuligerus]|uniref:Erythropoiesis-stimulating protein n=1 Tax=Streptomyces clavuligerus TaxID=1901 RepID=B5GVD0_STRCL|nr:LuxR family transcriptional regulator [Streptomyces clavuligerus]ANW17980.1 helix-turn-helix transcriptional regulator [Streptomyces clavuligerus]AXU12541.1 helix-turn-helix transcriptional regulator [Streptomyces clavuligerus]EDY50277.1 erythropoiesis-stimulating protein [Streptomyces clavuligerus]EFG09448.1 erythropoiesis-stimulating protein [Streptomyces clavuligerus]MBY6302437.1 helix-turn-helix domain-containing protein [Streptomyces clavuligerus]
MLEVLGLERHTEAVYRGMLADRTGGVAELARHLGLSESQVRDALDRLVDLGLLTPSREHTGGLRAVSPEAGLERLLRRQEEDLARRQRELALSKAAAARAVAEYADLRPNTETDGAERLVGLDAIQSRLEALTEELRGECLSIMPGGAQSQASLDASRPLDEKAMARGVEMCALYQDSVRNDSATLAYAQWTTEHGGQVRTSPVLPPRLLIFDRETAVVPIDPANSRLGALCTRSPGIVAALVTLFEQTWQAAVPLGAIPQQAPRDGITPGEQELLKLLASGMTDEAAGKRLGLSLRTVRRQMSSLMERLNATSRFEAGLKAAQRGWL